MLEKIKDISYHIVEVNYADGHEEYMIAVKCKVKGFLWGWNDIRFFIEMEDGKFTQTHDTFKRNADTQNAYFQLYASRFVTTKTIPEAEQIINEFKQHLETSQKQKLANTITEIKIIK